MAPGLHCGWIAALIKVITRFLSQTDVAAVSANEVSQAMLYKLLDMFWSRTLADRSAKRCARTLAMLTGVCMNHLAREFCSRVLPREGLFLQAAPSASPRSVDTDAAIYAGSKANAVLPSQTTWSEGTSTRRAWKSPVSLNLRCGVWRRSWNCCQPRRRSS